MGSEPTGYILELSQICRQFGTDPPVNALVNVDLTLKSAEWLAITGPSGSGKSTLLNIIGCLDHPTSGSYYLDGVDTGELSDNERAGLRSRTIGFVFQSFHLMPHRSVLENVMLAEVYRRQPHAGRRERALAAIERVGLGHRIDFLPTRLSGGERQRVAIARALVGSPSLLLCDEPTGNLDSKTTVAVLDLFEELNHQGLTVVVITHDEQVAQRAGRRVNIIDGALSEVRAPSANLAQPVVSNSASTVKAVPKSGMTPRDLFEEAIAGMFSKLGRTVLTILGIIIGITALVATLGLSSTASNRVISEFDELASTEIVVTARPGIGGVDLTAIPWDAPERIARLNGVVAAGTQSEVNIGNALVSSSQVKDPRSQTAFKLSIQAASPGLFSSVRADVESGRVFDLGHSVRMDRVAVLGPNAASRLNITSVDQLPAISIGDSLYLVIGILRGVGRQPNLLGSVIIPEGTARRDFGLVGPRAVIIETRIGATPLIVQQTATALRPDNKASLRVESPPEPKRVRDSVQSELNSMFLLLGGLSLIVGAIGIGNITLVSVIERTGEIGLRRAIGATRGHIASQFLLESTSLGFIGGTLGASLGLAIVVIVSAFQQWTPILHPAIPFVAPLVGGGIGLVSGTYPAMRAAALEPVEAFRN